MPEKWLKASVLGSLWAVVEITLGSMLHNLKIPLAGSILSFFTVFLVISFYQLWKENGVIWRAGLVCALMKSISPSAIILGPMIGIFAEALIIELAVRGFGKNLFAYTIGGALAVFSALVHKAVTLLILYGLDLVILFENLYEWGAVQLNAEHVKPIVLLTIISAIYLGSGAIAAIAGFISGKKGIEAEEQYSLKPLLKSDPRATLFKHSKKEAHSLPLLLTVLAFLITGMVVINQLGVFLSFLYTLLFSVFIALRYAHNMRYLKKPVFWLQLLLVLLFSAMFYRGFSLEGIARPEGWIVGLKMIFRAGLLLSAFSAISTELKNPVIRNILYKQGMKNLYQSLELAFSALPGLIEAFSLKRLKVWNFHKLVQTMLFSSQWLLDEYVSRQKNKPEIFIICGEVNQGKTKTAKKVVDKLVSAGIKVSGFYTVANKDVEGEKTYFIEDISSGKKQKLGTKNIPLGDIKKSRFVFSERGLDFGKKILEHTLNVPPELIVIDEIGPLEIKGKGWAPEIEKLLLKSNTPQLWTVRQKLVDVAIRKWNVGEVHIFNMNSNMHEYLAARITRIINVTKVTSAGEVQ